ncbi:hypothetical protein LXL04_008382 [Taraxacum kok-saghyz]
MVTLRLRRRRISTSHPVHTLLKIPLFSSFINFPTGVYKVPEVPYIPGAEAASVVTAVGSGVNNLKIRDVVYHFGRPMGTYMEEQIISTEKAIPPSIDPLVAASAMVKGLTARVRGMASCSITKRSVDGTLHIPILTMRQVEAMGYSSSLVFEGKLGDRSVFEGESSGQPIETNGVILTGLDLRTTGAKNIRNGPLVSEGSKWGWLLQESYWDDGCQLGYKWKLIKFWQLSSTSPP